jgi:hypothetical protein
MQADEDVLPYTFEGEKSIEHSPLQRLLSFDPKEHPSAAEVRVGEMYIYSLLTYILHPIFWINCYPDY